MISPPVPPALTGLWRRAIMVWPDGSTDATTEVLWLQTESLFGDIRIPTARPKPAIVDGFAGYSDADLIALAAMQGFAGTLEVDGSICRWHRQFDYQPPGGPPDEAGYAITDGLLIETGLHADYREDWVRETPPDALLAAFTLGDAMLVVAGDHFIEIRNRETPLPEAASLADLVAEDLTSGARTRAEERLGLRIAYGRIAPVDGPSWQIKRSTFPWLEDKSLFAVTPPLAEWRLEDTNRSESDLAPLFA